MPDDQSKTPPSSSEPTFGASDPIESAPQLAQSATFEREATVPVVIDTHSVPAAAPVTQTPPAATPPAQPAQAAPKGPVAQATVQPTQAPVTPANKPTQQV